MKVLSQQEMKQVGGGLFLLKKKIAIVASILKHPVRHAPKHPPKKHGH